ncbi:MAG: 50S ribosomal protein L9, partial [Chloroflexota bacterium]
MKVLLMKDVYNLGRAGEIKKVANGFGRNFLIPQKLALLATPGALKQVDRIKAEADVRRTVLNEELSSVAEELTGVQLTFPAKAGETGKLYGSVTTQMIAAALSEKLKIELSKRQIDVQPLRLLGMHKVKVRLTIDLIPELEVIVYREGEPIENYNIAAELLASTVESQMVDEEEMDGDEASIEKESENESEEESEEESMEAI